MAAARKIEVTVGGETVVLEINGQDAITVNGVKVKLGQTNAIAVDPAGNRLADNAPAPAAMTLAPAKSDQADPQDVEMTDED